MYGYNLGLAKAKVSESIPAAPSNVVLPSLVGNGAVGSVVTCSPGAWSGSPSPTFTFNFKLDTVSVQSGASNTYTPLIGDDTKTLTCTVTATNTEGSANADTSNSLVIGTVPNNTVAPVISGTNTFGSTLTTTNGTFTGTAPLTYTYQWLRGGSPITGETLSTYVIGASDSLAAITCEVKATNTYGFDSEVSNTITVQDFAPINTVAPTVSPSGTQSTGTLITANVGTWTGVAPITYEYKWTRDGLAISGATSSTYTIQLADDGTTIRVEVKGTNAYGVSGFIASSNSVSAVNVVAPTNSVAPVISGTAVVGQILTSTTGTWSGIPTPTYSYQWKRGATNIGTNATTYTLVAADAGQSITCVVTATNSAGSANATSNALGIIDTVVQKSGSASAAAYDINMVLNSSYANYSTQIVRVRRSGDNAEANYGVASNGYVDWSAITAYCVAGGGTQNGFVVTIYDQSGNGRNFTQSTPAAQMQIIASGVLLTDTGAGSGAVPRAAMRATGTQFYEIAASTAMFNFMHNGGDGWLLGVQRFGAVADPNASYVICANSGATTANAGFLVNYNDISPSLNNGILQLVERANTPRAVQNITNNAAMPNQTSVVNFQFDADNATADNRGISWVNNGSGNQNNIQTSAPSTANAGTNLQWGGTGVGAGFTGSLQRLVIWNANLSTQRTTLTSLTNSYYGAY